MTVPSRLLGAAALLLGLWTGCGGCLWALGSLGPAGDAPDSALLGAAVQEAVYTLSIAASTWAPVDGGIALLATLAGLGLVVSGALTLIGTVPMARVLLRVAFLVSAVVDLAQLLWMLAWFALLWQPYMDYTRAIARTVQSSSPPDGVAAASALTIIVLSFGYYLIKIGVAVFGAVLIGGDRAGESTPPETRDPSAGWAD